VWLSEVRYRLVFTLVVMAYLGCTGKEADRWVYSCLLLRFPHCYTYSVTMVHLVGCLCRNGSIGSLIDVLASEPSDYSYFKTDLMRTWAGPEHWKLQPKPKGKFLKLFFVRRVLHT